MFFRKVTGKRNWVATVDAAVPRCFSQDGYRRCRRIEGTDERISSFQLLITARKKEALWRSNISKVKQRLFTIIRLLLRGKIRASKLFWLLRWGKESLRNESVGIRPVMSFCFSHVNTDDYLESKAEHSFSFLSPSTVVFLGFYSRREPTEIGFLRLSFSHLGVITCLQGSPSYDKGQR